MPSTPTIQTAATNTTPTVGVESSLVTITTAGVYIAMVDLNAHVLGDEIEFYVYGKLASGDTKRLMDSWLVGPVTPIWPIQFSVPYTVGAYFEFALKQTAGTARAWRWAIYQI